MNHGIRGLLNISPVLYYLWMRAFARFFFNEFAFRMNANDILLFVTSNLSLMRIM